MFTNDYVLHKVSERRMLEDQRWAAMERMANSSRRHFDLFFWLRKVSKVLRGAGKDPSEKKLQAGRGILTLQGDREARELSYRSGR